MRGQAVQRLQVFEQVLGYYSRAVRCACGTRRPAPGAALRGQWAIRRAWRSRGVGTAPTTRGLFGGARHGSGVGPRAREAASSQSEFASGDRRLRFAPPLRASRWSSVLVVVAHSTRRPPRPPRRARGVRAAFCAGIAFSSRSSRSPPQARRRDLRPAVEPANFFVPLARPPRALDSPVRIFLESVRRLCLRTPRRPSPVAGARVADLGGARSGLARRCSVDRDAGPRPSRARPRARPRSPQIDQAPRPSPGQVQVSKDNGAARRARATTLY